MFVASVVIDSSVDLVAGERASMEMLARLVWPCRPGHVLPACYGARSYDCF